MQWSPVKLAGNKRTLDAVGEADDTPGESEDEREDGEMSEEDELEGNDVDCYLAPEDSSDRINAQEPEEAPPELDEPTEQHEARPRKQTLSSHEISASHTSNTNNSDVVVSHSNSMPHEQNQPKSANNTNNEPQPSTQRRGEAPTAGGRQNRRGQPLSRGEHTGELGVPTETALSRSPTDTSHTARRQERNTGGKRDP
jgi:hypothetical protein